MKSPFKAYLALALITVLSSLFFWLALYTNLPSKLGFPASSLETVFSNYDGPNYMVISKCGYNKNCIGPSFSLPLPLEYYPAHLPGFPLLIKSFSFITTGPKAMLLATLLGSVFLSIISYEFFRLYTKQKYALFLSLLLIFFPARLYVLHQVGAPETWFIASILASIFFFKKQKYLLAAAFTALAQTFKSPGIILFAAYGLIFLKELFFDKKPFLQLFKKYLAFALVPATIILIFYSYYLQTGDFLAYFHSGDNFHLEHFPYLVFVSNHTWINSIWLEEVVYIFLLSSIGVYRLLKKKSWDIVAIFPLLFLIATIFVAHRDISRYIAPIYPFIFLSYAKLLNKTYIKIILLLLLPAIILYGFNFVIGNTAPIADWTPYL